MSEKALQLPLTLIKWKLESCLTGGGLRTFVLNYEAVPWDADLLAPEIDRTVKESIYFCNIDWAAISLFSAAQNMDFPDTRLNLN